LLVAYKAEHVVAVEEFIAAAAARNVKAKAA
jgi:hypothetical protein